jgi:hypothetical protein
MFKMDEILSDGMIRPLRRTYVITTPLFVQDEEEDVPALRVSRSESKVALAASEEVQHASSDGHPSRNRDSSEQVAYLQRQGLDELLAPHMALWTQLVVFDDQGFIHLSSRLDVDRLDLRWQI